MHQMWKIGIFVSGLLSPALVSAQSTRLIFPDIAGEARKGYAAGMAARHAEEEHAARMRLMEAEAQAIETSNQAQQYQAQNDIRTDPGVQPSIYYRVNYSCPKQDGTTYLSEIPVPGCIVLSLDFNP